MRKRNRLSTSLAIAAGLVGLAAATQAGAAVLLPPTAGMYHGAFPDYPEYPAPVYGERLANFEQLVNKPIAWAEVPNDWVDGIQFPIDAATAINAQGVVPYIRVLPRSQRVQNAGADPYITLNQLAEGAYDQSIINWAMGARQVGFPVLVDFAPEANGRWYSWNGEYIGGPGVYVAAYQHFVDVVRAQGVTNITWFFHIDSQPQPVADWNTMAAYYPGDNYVDWIGISVFGAQLPWDYWEEFTDILDRAYTEFSSISTTKPLAVVEWGVTEDYNNPGRKAQWINNALTALKTGRYPGIQALSYWHEGPWADAQNLRIDSSVTSLQAYETLIGDPFFATQVQFTDPNFNSPLARRKR
jgi:hypothetical protein